MGVNDIKNKAILTWIIIFFITIFLCIINLPTNQEKLYIDNYIVNFLSIFIIEIIIFCYSYKGKKNIYDPLYFVTIIYVLCFFVAPIYDILIRDYFWFSVNLFEYGVKGSIVALIGFVSFYLGYNSKIKPGIKIKNKITKTSKYNYKKIAFVSIIIWLVCLIISLFYLKKAGKSFLYVLSLGSSGFDESAISEESLGALSMFSYSLLPATMLYIECGKNKYLKIFIFIITLLIEITRGFRFIIIIQIISIIVYYVIKKRKRVKIYQLFLLTVIFIFIIGLVGYTRGDMRSGNGVMLTGFSFEYCIDSVINNFRIYKTYYAVIKTVPEIVPFNYFNQIVVYSLIMTIPRAIWKSKPFPDNNVPISKGISQYASEAGQAYPNCGEFYYSFGIIGVIFFMYIFGMFSKKIYRLLSIDDPFNLIMFSLLYGSLFQLIIRGYTPSNLWLLVFLLWPILIVKKLD